jgi:hypothetical protein
MIDSNAPWSGRVKRTTATRRFAPLLMAAVLLRMSAASAAPPVACDDSYVHAQRLRKEAKLIEAREELRVCARPACPNLMVNDCTRWLEEVDASIPSVVPLATDEQGVNLVDVKLSIDGVPRSSSLDGTAIDLDPGPHKFTFELASRPVSETTVLVAIGEKNKRVAVTLEGPPISAAPPHTSMSAQRIAGITLGAAGVLSLGVGVAFGVDALMQQHDAGCPGNVCGAGANPSALRSAHTDGNVSTATLIVGGVLAAAGVTTWLLAPRPSAERATGWIRPGAVSVAGGGGVGVVGEW